jgi:hypothetical protein
MDGLGICTLIEEFIASIKGSNNANNCKRRLYVVEYVGAHLVSIAKIIVFETETIKIAA